jgi:hypothetical protein
VWTSLQIVKKEGIMKVEWQALIRYQNLIPYMNPEVRDIFDTLQELIPIVWGRDRAGTFLTWREKAIDAGLLTTREVHNINNEMTHGCGGL